MNVSVNEHIEGQEDFVADKEGVHVPLLVHRLLAFLRDHLSVGEHQMVVKDCPHVFLIHHSLHQ